MVSSERTSISPGPVFTRMVIRVDGTVRRRSVLRLGPFRRESWAVSPFSWVARKVGSVYEAVLPGLELAVERTNGIVLVKALVDGFSAHLFHAKEGISDSRRFTFLSVGGIEVEGTVEIEADEEDEKAPPSA